eukprot:TRINITY_DN35016_c0_g1_i1.p1 TRINITY_DN35016_c0_g1~~TRINITY_DN35016_c0_g1_i1.p1  ORF type:complete len:658 (+),score=195.32 TRINITY_DN35016_c0_g1_i1:75-2048(+)
MRLGAALLLMCCWCRPEEAAAAAPRFVRVELDPGFCGDGCGCVLPQTTPSFLFSPGTGDGRTRWIILLSAGRFCTELPCDTAPDDGLEPPPDMRPGDFQHLAPPQLARGILSSNAEENEAFYQYNKVWLMDCTRDLFLGANLSSGQAGRSNFAAMLAHLADSSTLTVDPLAEGWDPPLALTAAAEVYLVGEGLAAAGALTLVHLLNLTLQHLACDTRGADCVPPARLRVLLSGGCLWDLHSAQPQPSTSPSVFGNCAKRPIDCPAGEPVEWRGGDGVWRQAVVQLRPGPPTPGGWHTVRLRNGTAYTGQRVGALRKLLPLSARIARGLSVWNYTPDHWPEWCRDAPESCGMLDRAAPHIRYPLQVSTSVHPPALAWAAAGVDLTPRVHHSAAVVRAVDRWAKVLERDMFEAFFQVGEHLKNNDEALLLAVQCDIDRLLTSPAFHTLRVGGSTEPQSQLVDRWVLGLGRRHIDWDTCNLRGPNVSAQRNCNPLCQLVLPVPPPPAPERPDPTFPPWGVLLIIATGIVMVCCFCGVVLVYPNRRQHRERERHLTVHTRNLQTVLDTVLSREPAGGGGRRGLSVQPLRDGLGDRSLSGVSGVRHVMSYATGTTDEADDSEGASTASPLSGTGLSLKDVPGGLRDSSLRGCVRIRSDLSGS